MPPVPQGDLAHVPHAQSVDERVPGLDLVDDPGGSVPELDDGAVLGEDDVLAWNASLLSEARRGPA